MAQKTPAAVGCVRKHLRINLLFALRNLHLDVVLPRCGMDPANDLARVDGGLKTEPSAMPQPSARNLLRNGRTTDAVLITPGSSMAAAARVCRSRELG
jgi:hypothetical protein